MSSEVSADIVKASGAIRIKREGAETPVDIPANGVLVVSELDGASITIGGGGATQLVGIQYLDVNGNAVVIDNDLADVKFFRAAPGVTITVMHNQTVDLDMVALPAVQRILTSSGKNFTLALANTQAFFAYAAAPVSGFRWGFNDRHNYNADPAHFDAPLPDTDADAITRIAAAVSGLLGGLIP